MLVSEFIELHYKPLRVKQFSESWQYTIETQHLPVIARSFATMDWRTITFQYVVAWWDYLQTIRGKGLARKIFITFRSMCTLARDLGLVDCLPTAYVKIRSSSASHGQLITHFMYRELYSRANYRLKGYLMFGYYTGARSRSIRLLEWDDLDFTEGIIHFRHTKAGIPYSVPMHRFILRTYAHLRGSDSGRKTVLPYYESKSLSTAFKRLATRCGYPSLRFHDLRHSFARRLLDEHGASLKSIQQLLGHQSLNSTAIYATVSNKTLTSQIQQLL